MVDDSNVATSDVGEAGFTVSPVVNKKKAGQEYDHKDHRPRHENAKHEAWSGQAIASICSLTIFGCAVLRSLVFTDEGWITAGIIALDVREPAVAHLAVLDDTVPADRELDLVVRDLSRRGVGVDVRDVLEAVVESDLRPEAVQPGLHGLQRARGELVLVVGVGGVADVVHVLHDKALVEALLVVFEGAVVNRVETVANLVSEG